LHEGDTSRFTSKSVCKDMTGRSFQVHVTPFQTPFLHAETGVHA
jgi:hypothetical protein